MAHECQAHSFSGVLLVISLSMHGRVPLRCVAFPLVQEGRSYFPLVKFISGQHELSFMNTFSMWLETFTGITQPLAARFFTAALYERSWGRYFIKGTVKNFRISMQVRKRGEMRAAALSRFSWRFPAPASFD